MLYHWDSRVAKGVLLRPPAERNGSWLDYIGAADFYSVRVKEQRRRTDERQSTLERRAFCKNLRGAEAQPHSPNKDSEGKEAKLQHQVFEIAKSVFLVQG